MDFSRRELVGVGVKLTGLAALVGFSAAKVFADDSKGYNYLVPSYDESHPNDRIRFGSFLGVEHYALAYSTENDIITKYYVGMDNYAIEIRKKESGKPALSSFILLDDKGDGIFRRKMPELDEHGKPNSIGPPQWIRLKYSRPQERKKI